MQGAMPSGSNSAVLGPRIAQFMLDAGYRVIPEPFKASETEIGGYSVQVFRVTPAVEPDGRRLMTLWRALGGLEIHSPHNFVVLSTGSEAPWLVVGPDREKIAQTLICWWANIRGKSTGD